MVDILQGDCLELLGNLGPVDCIFADPPDNIGLGYAGDFNDKLPAAEYRQKLESWVAAFVRCAPVVWLSFNSRHLVSMGAIVEGLQNGPLSGWKVLPCVQTFTFGQHNKNDLGNCQRPLWRFTAPGVKLYPEKILVPSWRQLNGDKRANPGGKVPGDVFDFPRVTGNSKQRRRWHVTQLNEGLVERCLLLTTPSPGRVVDPFGGSGTTGRVCQRLGLDCTLIELNPVYVEHLRAEFP